MRILILKRKMINLQNSKGLNESLCKKGNDGKNRELGMAEWGASNTALRITTPDSVSTKTELASTNLA